MTLAGVRQPSSSPGIAALLFSFLKIITQKNPYFLFDNADNVVLTKQWGE
jgi:hypothetical protein